MRGKKSTGKREQDTWKDVGHPKDTQGEAVRGGEEVNETEQGCQGDRKTDNGPLWPFPGPVWAPFSGQ